MPRFLTALLCFLVFIGGLLLYITRVPPMPQPGTMPQPNGYEDFRAATLLLRGELSRSGQTAPEELAAFVATNQPSLDRVRIGLSRASMVPPLDPTNVQAKLDDLGRMKQIARLFAAEAEIARQHGDWDRLVKTSAEGIDFGLRIAQGGVMIDQMLATAAEAIARTPLEKAASDIPAGPARHAAAALLALETAREPFRRVRLNEEAFAQRSSSRMMRIAWQLFLKRRTRVVFDKTEAKVTASTLATRHLILQLAARAYALDHGQPPATPATLVPQYLPSIPNDPSTGEPITIFPPHARPSAPAPD